MVAGRGQQLASGTNGFHWFFRCAGRINGGGVGIRRCACGQDEVTFEAVVPSLRGEGTATAVPQRLQPGSPHIAPSPPAPRAASDNRTLLMLGRCRTHIPIARSARSAGHENTGLQDA